MNDIKKQFGKNICQMSLPNFVMIFVVFLIALFMLPVMNTVIEAAATSLLLTPSDSTALTISVMRLIPFALILGIIIYAIHTAIPQGQGGIQ